MEPLLATYGESIVLILLDCLVLFIGYVVPLAIIENSLTLAPMGTPRWNKLACTMAMGIASSAVWGVVIVILVRLNAVSELSILILAVWFFATNFLIGKAKCYAYPAITKMHVTKKRGRTIVLLNCIVPFIALIPMGVLDNVLYLCYELNRQYLAPVTFNQQSWQTEKGHLSSIRQRMLCDLITRYKLIGMSRDEAESLLGKPDIKTSHNELSYELGPRGWDSMWITLYFDSNKKVSKYRVWSD